MARNLLHLTAAERKLFEKLSAVLKDGWEVEEEVSLKEERPEELVMRARMADFTSAIAKGFVEKARSAKSADELQRLLTSFDVTALPRAELMEIFFVLGTGGLSHMVRALLENAATDEDLEGAMTLTGIRRALSEANATVS